jgi:hypothetical protein
MNEEVIEREGDLLVVPAGAVLPDRCVATGVPTGGNAVHRRLAWIPEWTLALCVLVSPLFGLIAMAITRKSARLTYFVAPHVARRRRAAMRTGLGLIAGSGLAFAAGVADDVDALLVTALVLLCLGLILLDAVGRPFRVHRITRERIYLRVNADFWPRT